MGKSSSKDWPPAGPTGNARLKLIIIVTSAELKTFFPIQFQPMGTCLYQEFPPDRDDLLHIGTPA